MDVTAVSADPNDLFAALKDYAVLKVLDKGVVTLLMLLLDLSDHLEKRCDSVEALLLGDFGELLVHLCPLVVLACCGIKEIILC